MDRDVHMHLQSAGSFWESCRIRLLLSAAGIS